MRVALIFNRLALVCCFFGFAFAKDTVFVKLDGGIGNQMFQFAAGYALAQTIGADLKVISLGDNKSSSDPNDRRYIINCHDFNISGIEFIADMPPNFDRLPHVWEGSDFIKRKGLGQIMIGSFFESEIFFKKFKSEIKRMLQPKKIDTPFIRKYLTLITSCNSVAVHIRRGDFLQYPYRIMSITYYHKAMQLFRDKKNVKFFIFSDDPDYIKENFSNKENVILVSEKGNGATNVAELYLMTCCKHIITANSTFSWWAAYLNSNPEAMVVAPYPRYREEYYNSHPVGFRREIMRYVYKNRPYPMQWFTIDPFKED